MKFFSLLSISLSFFLTGMSKPVDYIPIASVHGITLWAEPNHHVSIYGSHDKWTFFVEGEGEKDGTREVTEEFIRQMNQKKWFEQENIAKGHVEVTGRLSSMRFEFSWETKKDQKHHTITCDHLPSSLKKGD